MVMLRIVATWQIDSSLQVTSTQWTESSLMVVLQRTARPRVVIRPQAGKSPIVKSASLYMRNPAGKREHNEDSPVERGVDTILVDLTRPKKAITLATNMSKKQGPTSGRGALYECMSLREHNTKTK